MALDLNNPECSCSRNRGQHEGVRRMVVGNDRLRTSPRKHDTIFNSQAFRQRFQFPSKRSVAANKLCVDVLHCGNEIFEPLVIDVPADAQQKPGSESSSYALDFRVIHCVIRFGAEPKRNHAALSLYVLQCSDVSDIA